MRDRQTCIDCAKQSPETDTNYTLISAQFGWRLTRKRHADGTFVVEWRCPDCWRLFKNTKAANEPIIGWPSSQLEAAPPSRAGAPPSPPPQSVARPQKPAATPVPPTPPSGTRGSSRPAPLGKEGSARRGSVPPPKGAPSAAGGEAIPRPPGKPR